MTTTITITYKAFSNNERPITSATIEIEPDLDVFSDTGWCDFMYEVTNLQDEIYDFTRNATKLFVWNKLKPLLPVNRTHTSLSVGDEITINENTYRCENVGWELLQKVGN
jgi:hypothetical protein